MKPHTKIYFDFFGITPGDFVPCEICGKEAKDINHIEPRGMGGDPQGKKDTIENLMAVCRECHVKYGDKKQYKLWLKSVHNNRMVSKNIDLND